MRSTELLERVGAHLLENGYAPGDRLPSEVELASRFGVSRGAIREVIMHLCFLGVLERATSRGTHVRAVSSDVIANDLAFRIQLSGYSFDELKETRLCMETGVLPLIARRLTPETAEALRGNIDRMAALVGTPEEADLLDKEFHLQLFDVCGNRTLRLFSHVIARLFDRAFRGAFLNSAAVLKSVRDHRALMDAFAAGDTATAHEILTSHIAAT